MIGDPLAGEIWKSPSFPIPARVVFRDGKRLWISFIGDENGKKDQIVATATVANEWDFIDPTDVDNSFAVTFDPDLNRVLVGDANAARRMTRNKAAMLAAWLVYVADPNLRRFELALDQIRAVNGLGEADRAV